MKFEYKAEFLSPKKSYEVFFFKPIFLFKIFGKCKNAIIQILILVLFYRLIVATHIGIVFLMVLQKLTAKTK